MKLTIFNYPYWQYIPNVFAEKDYFSDLYDGLIDQVKSYTQTIYGKTSESKRISCVFTHKENACTNFGFGVDAKSKGFSYFQTPIYEWANAPQLLLDVKNRVEHLCDIKWDYVLVHIYRDREDYIGYHNDRESLTLPVCSVSFGCTRMFEIKEKGKKGDKPDFRFELNNGDIFYMKGRENIKDKTQKGCQEVYVHRIPKISLGDIKEILDKNNISTEGVKRTYESYMKLINDGNIEMRRINMTFRQFPK